MADFSLQACKESVKFDVEVLKKNPFELLGRYIVRAEQDIFFNETMIYAVKEYIAENNLKWDDK